MSAVARSDVSRAIDAELPERSDILPVEMRCSGCPPRILERDRADEPTALREHVALARLTALARGGDVLMRRVEAHPGRGQRRVRAVEQVRQLVS